MRPAAALSGLDCALGAGDSGLGRRPGQAAARTSGGSTALAALEGLHEGSDGVE